MNIGHSFDGDPLDHADNLVVASYLMTPQAATSHDQRDRQGAYEGNLVVGEVLSCPVDNASCHPQE